MFRPFKKNYFDLLNGDVNFAIHKEAFKDYHLMKKSDIMIKAKKLATISMYNGEKCTW